MTPMTPALPTRRGFTHGVLAGGLIGPTLRGFGGSTRLTQSNTPEDIRALVELSELLVDINYLLDLGPALLEVLEEQPAPWLQLAAGLAALEGSLDGSPFELWEGLRRDSLAFLVRAHFPWGWTCRGYKGLLGYKHVADNAPLWEARSPEQADELKILEAAGHLGSAVLYYEVGEYPLALEAVRLVAQDSPFGDQAHRYEQIWNWEVNQVVPDADTESMHPDLSCALGRDQRAGIEAWKRTMDSDSESARLFQRDLRYRGHLRTLAVVEQELEQARLRPRIKRLLAEEHQHIKTRLRQRRALLMEAELSRLNQQAEFGVVSYRAPGDPWHQLSRFRSSG